MAISSVTPSVYVNPQQTQVAAKDSDGDTDGSKAAATAKAPAASAPVVSNPTDTMGNNVNTHA